MNALDWIARILVIVGALNWVLALYSWNLVDMIFGAITPVLATIVYWLIGLAGLWELIALFKK